jgi:Phage tail sheath C-terminal domain/Phage tail sheath protein subtilisin-like domain
MAETFSLSELIIPGTYIDVRAEGLIGVGGLSTGNIGIVGTAQKLDENGDPVEITGETFIISDYATAQETFGRYDAFSAGTLNLTRAFELLYRNGARTVFARALEPDAAAGDFASEFDELVKDDVNILIAPQLSTEDALGVLTPVVESAQDNGRDVIAVVGSDATVVSDIRDQVVSNDRLILAAPAVVTSETVIESGRTVSRDVTLSGGYTAAAIAGLLSTLPPEDSPTNKVLAGVKDLAQRFSYGQEKNLIGGGVLVLERRQGVRVVRGITTEMVDNGPFRQITTRRITDFAKAGIRQASNPFIGRLNNQRVRAALQAAIEGFLTTMVADEALIGYSVEVTATRQDEINGRAIVNAVIQPTFSIDFVAVTLVLQ